MSVSAVPWRASPATCAGRAICSALRSRKFTRCSTNARARFVDVGFTPEDAEAHARFLMEGYNGAILLAYAQDDDALITSGVSSLQRWLRELRTSRGDEAR